MGDLTRAQTSALTSSPLSLLQTSGTETHMPHDDGLPQTGDSQEIGQDAYDCLRAKRPKGWQLTELGGVNDFGFDLQVQISVKQQIVHPFRLQLKGTRSPKRSADGTFLSIALLTSTLRYFDNTDEPVLLVLCDLSTNPEDPRECNLYYVWMREELERIEIASIPLSQDEAVVRVPTANVLDRSTDLVEEVRKRHRLSRVGHALETSVAGMDPSLGSEDRVVMVEAITRNIGTRNIVFAQALAEPATEVWLNPPRGSLAWLLTEAKAANASGKVDKCDELLRQAAERLANCTGLERAEYWHITGRSRLVRGDDEGASEAFRIAAETQPQAKYWAAWAESEMRRRFRTDQGDDYSDVLAALPSDTDPALLAVKARLLAASRKHDEAIALLATFEGLESLAARAVVQTMYSNSDEALQACVEGLSSDDKRDSTRLLFLILRARARFNIALRGAQVEDSSRGESEDEVLPPSGPIGVDASALRAAWDDIEEAVSALEEIRWVSNAEFVIDLWIGTASMLGKQQQILARVLAAARLRPQQAELQSAAETLAAQCGDFESALEANTRLPESGTKILRRVCFLHDLGKHRDCVELMAAHVETVSRSHQLFGPALVVATLSADVMARADLVKSWRAILDTGDLEKQAHAATLDYMLARCKNQLQSSAPLAELLRIDEQLGHPKPTTLMLFQELDVGSETDAEQFLVVAARLRSTIRLSPLIAVRIGVALATLERWDQLLALCEEAENEFEVTGRIKAFQALALDQLGRSDEARTILESMLEGGIDDGLALNTYVNIMVRWGFTEQAKSAAELILERAQTRERRLECIRMLFNLEQHANPTSPRLVDLAFRMGELAAREDEAEEGVFLCMVMVASSFDTTTMSESRKEEFQSRANAFFEKFPQSKVIRRIELPTDAGAEEMLRSMNSAVGISEEREQQRAQLEAKLQSGELPLPFAWRPKFALGNVQDVAHLWELAKRSTLEDKKFHLNMIGQRWEQRRADSFRSRTPLLDLLTLFLLKDLGLLDRVFDFFPKIAISQETLGELMRMSQAFSGSIFRSRCIELQESLRPRLAQIMQPRGTPSDEDGHLPRSSRELKILTGSGEYMLYSDDAIVRMWILEEKYVADGMCTLDLLCGLEEVGLLTTEEVAVRLAQLCEWHVGIQIQLRHQLALIPPAVRIAPRVADAASLLRGAEKFMSLAAGMWGPGTDFMGSLNHIGQVVRILVHDPAISDAAIGAFTTVWIDHAIKKPDMPLPALQLAAHIALYAVAAEKLPITAARRLWNIYFGVVEAIQGALDPKAASLALARVAREAGAIDKRMAQERITPASTIGERLMMGLDINSEAWVGFCAVYLRGRS
jgi:tetratricopeptide (TPR) repeat protein